ncbi:ML domain protein [Musa troglodytarum]|uniref:ML domain protein n=1 Tax=Musa troglodytarum TaxID=320322 RepID=A0A9E7FS35_9LILI|nr:ML domain protein [Musa troglodytarum]
MASLLDRRALPLLFLLAACAIATDVRYCRDQISTGKLGSYTLTMRMAGEDGEQLTCITFGFSIGFVVPVADN